MNDKQLDQLRRMAGILTEKHGHYAPVEGDEVPQNDHTGDHHKPKKGMDMPPKSTGDTPHTDDESTASLHDGGKNQKSRKGGEGKDGEEPTFPEIVTAMAAKMEGKTGDELIELVSKLYDAGVKDGVAQAKAEEEGGEPKEEKPKKEKKKDDNGEEAEELPPEDFSDEVETEEEPKKTEKEMKEALEVKRLRRLINY